MLIELLVFMTFILAIYSIVVLYKFSAPCRKAYKQKKAFYKAYTRLGGKPYSPKKLCADTNSTLEDVTYDGCHKDPKWLFGPEKFWEGPPAPKAADIEKWEAQQRKNIIARDLASREVYGVGYSHE
jgi:hypothetical protein